MSKKRKIFILSALAAGIAIFFGRKRMKSKSEEASSGDWTPDADDTTDETAASDAAEDAESLGAESLAEDDSSEAAEEEAAETSG